MATSFTDRELDIMTVLWEIGSGTVADVQKRLPDRLAYTTVLTMLRILEAKGSVAHVSQGKAHRYVPIIDRDVAGQGFVARMLSTVFRGVPELLLMQLVNNRDLSQEELERMREIVERRIEDQTP